MQLFWGPKTADVSTIHTYGGIQLAIQDPLKPLSSRIATFSAISASPTAPKIAKKAVSTAVLRVQNRCILAYFSPIFHRK